MHDQPISEVSSHKHLGVTLSSDCTWHLHINSIKEKAWKRVNIMRKLKYTLDRESLETIYVSFIRPLLEYGDVLWENCTLYDKQELNKIQNEAARIVSGTTKLVSINDLYLEVAWESLESRRRKHKLFLLYKMINGLTPAQLSSLVPSRVGDMTNYPLRNRDNLQTVPARTTLYRNSFIPSVIREWNALPLVYRQANTLPYFKYLLNRDRLTVPKFLLVGNRKEQVLHARLRRKCSSLNHHLFLKNVIDSPLCTCGCVKIPDITFCHVPYTQVSAPTL